VAAATAPAPVRLPVKKTVKARIGNAEPLFERELLKLNRILSHKEFLR